MSYDAELDLYYCDEKEARLSPRDKERVLMDCCKVTVIGRLGADAELGTTKDGKPFARLRVAASVGRGEHETTNWFSVTLWDKLAESVGQMLFKGDRVAIIGTLELETFNDRQGVEKQGLKITWVDQFLMLSPRKEDAPARDREEPRRQEHGRGPAGWPAQRNEDFDPPRGGGREEARRSPFDRR